MSFTKHILFATLLTKSEHTIKQAVAFSFPVSTLYSSNAWDHDPFQASKAKWLTFYDFKVLIDWQDMLWISSYQTCYDIEQ